MTDAVADRFSEIPDELIHKIYSFLDMKEVLGTTLLSKRWRYLWHSLTNLNFNEHTGYSIGYEMTLKERMKSWEFVEQVLLRHDGPNIQKLRLSNYSCHLKRLHALLDSAFEQHVQELHLENMEAPGTALTISSYELNYLIVENYASRSPSFSARAKKSGNIAICAPNLTTLQLKGDMFNEYNMDNLSALVTAEIDVHITDMYCKTREVRRSCFSRIFSGVGNVESLTLPTHCFKFLPGLFDGPEAFPVSFNNLKHLKLTEWRERRYINVMEKLFGCFPNLEILILEGTEACGSEKEGDWEAVLSSDSIFGHLKIVEIQKFDGSKNEYKFLEFVLNNAMVLEQIILKVTKSLPEEKAKELVDFSKKLLIMHKASPRVSVRLMMKIEGRYTILFEESCNLFKSPPTPT